MSDHCNDCPVDETVDNRLCASCCFYEEYKNIEVVWALKPETPVKDGEVEKARAQIERCKVRLYNLTDLKDVSEGAYLLETVFFFEMFVHMFAFENGNLDKIEEDLKAFEKEAKDKGLLLL